MLKLYKNALKITNDNIILATPLILFMWILSLYLGFSKLTVNSLPLLLLSGVTVLFMMGAFFGGWFYMVKKAIKLSKQVFILDSDRAKATFNLIKTMPAGVGKYFLSFLGMILLSAVIVSVAGIGIFQLGINIIGPLGLDANQLKDVLSSASDMKAFLDSLSFEQLIKLNNWNMLFLTASSLFAFLFMLWAPEIVYHTRNPFMALVNSLKKIFIKFWKSVQLFIFISVLNFVLAFINTFSMVNIIFYFIMLVIYFYFIVYVVVLIFSYYDKEFE